MFLGARGKGRFPKIRYTRYYNRASKTMIMVWCPNYSTLLPSVVKDRPCDPEVEIITPSK